MDGPGFVVWFTGLSGSGKSTLSSLLSAELRERGVVVEVLDGDEVRTHLSKGLGFSREDRDTNVRRIGFVAKLVARAGACVMTAAISPYRDVRDEQRRAIGRFVEVYCRCPIDVLAARDPKGLYEKALRGELAHFTGVDDPYEAPLAPELELDTASESAGTCVARIITKLEALGYLGAAEEARRGLVRPHGGELPGFDALGAATGRTLVLSSSSEDALRLILAGALAPVRGFLGPKDLIRVTKEMRLEGGHPFAWPLELRIGGERAVAPVVGERVALSGADGATLAVMDVRSVENAGADVVEGPAFSVGGPFVSGCVDALGIAAGTRAKIEQLLQLQSADDMTHRVAGLLTPRPLHRGDELALRLALEISDVLVLAVASADPRVREAVRLTVAAALRPGRVVVVDLPALPTLSDARRALTVALILKNLGVSHLVARADEDDALTGTLAAFSKAELGLSILPVGRPILSATGELLSERTAPIRPGQRPLEWLAIAETLSRHEWPSSEDLRPEVASLFVNEVASDVGPPTRRTAG